MAWLLHQKPTISVSAVQVPVGEEMEIWVCKEVRWLWHFLRKMHGFGDILETLHQSWNSLEARHSPFCSTDSGIYNSGGNYQILKMLQCLIYFYHLMCIFLKAGDVAQWQITYLDCMRPWVQSIHPPSTTNRNKWANYIHTFGSQWRKLAEK